MKIGFDIDGVTCDLNGLLAEITRNRFNVEVPENPESIHVIEQYSGLPVEEAHKYFWDLVLKERIFKDAPVHQDFLDLFNKCVEDPRIEVFVITHRFYYGDDHVPQHADNIIQKDTAQWFKTNAPKFDPQRIFYARGDKTLEAKELDLDLFMDDRPSVTEVMADVCMSLLVTRGWNLSYKEQKPIRIFKAVDADYIIKGFLAGKE